MIKSRERSPLGTPKSFKVPGGDDRYWVRGEDPLISLGHIDILPGMGDSIGKLGWQRP